MRRPPSLGPAALLLIGAALALIGVGIATYEALASLFWPKRAL